MPACLLSQDVLAICLVLADGDVDLSVEDVIHRAEQYQETAHRHFGISETDFRGLFLWLIGWELGLTPYGSAMDAIRLGDLANGMLGYHDAYWNDEGNYWTDTSEDETQSQYLDDEVRDFPFYRDLDDGQWQEKLRHREEIKAFFQGSPCAIPDVESVKGLMARLNITGAVLRAFSRSGSRS